jgi:threonine/homoserine/homoserine lactone efflux protein
MMLLSSGTRFGFARTIPHMLGICFGLVIMMLMAGAGLVSVFQAFPLAYTTLKILGIGYLLYLAWSIATADTQAKGEEGGAGTPVTFVQAALFQWVNPKAITMTLTTITAYVPLQQPVLGVGIAAAIYGLVCLPSVGLWALMGTQIRRFLNNPQKLRLFNVAAALALILSLYPIVMA